MPPELAAAAADAEGGEIDWDRGESDLFADRGTAPELEIEAGPKPPPPGAPDVPPAAMPEEEEAAVEFSDHPEAEDEAAKRRQP